jgi:hypothetical protein
MPFEPPGELPPREQRQPIPENWDEYVSVARRWLEQQWGDRPCAYCQHNVWRINEVVSLVNAPGWPTASEGPPSYYPAMPVICATCGHIVLVNAVYIFRL